MIRLRISSSPSLTVSNRLISSSTAPSDQRVAASGEWFRLTSTNKHAPKIPCDTARMTPRSPEPGHDLFCEELHRANPLLVGLADVVPRREHVDTELVIAGKLLTHLLDA